MSGISAKKWMHKAKIKYQPTSGALGLYKPKKLLDRLTLGRFWGEEGIRRFNSKRDTPVLYRTPGAAIRAGRRFKKRHTYQHPEPYPLQGEHQ